MIIDYGGINDAKIIKLEVALVMIDAGVPIHCDIIFFIITVNLFLTLKKEHSELSIS